MTDRQIEQMAIRVADIVIQALEDKQHEWDKALVADLHEQNTEQQLLAQLATAMTQLDFALSNEDYALCAELKKQILKIENQLNKYK
jgi:ABC-type metal ion transport system substrate-binding protein